MLSIIWSINIITFAYIFIGPIIPFYLIFNIFRMLFWGGIYITLSPLTSDSTYMFPGENFTTDVESTTYTITAFYNTYIHPISQVGLGIVSLITHMFGFLVMLCVGDEIDSITTRLWPSPHAAKTDDGFLARLDAALTLGSILAKGYAIMRALVMYVVNSPSFVEVTDRRRELYGKRFEVLGPTDGISAKSDEMVISCRQAGSKFFHAIESGYASTGEDDINGEYGFHEGKCSDKE
ncbi:hypothetical protein EV426DRAFT_578906 [Tirmania nivea]|nr:hypothetical protein EV426DRAFT_578906 [Tirmania nivea]